MNHHAGAAHIDLGHGSFSTPGTGSDYFVVVPPHASTNIVVDGDHSLLDIAQRAELPFDSVRQAAETLFAHDLLVEQPEGAR